MEGTRSFRVLKDEISGHKIGDTVRLRFSLHIKAPHEIEIWQDPGTKYSYTDGALSGYVRDGVLLEIM